MLLIEKLMPNLPCKLVNIVHFVAKTCPVVPIFPLQKDNIFLFGKMRPQNPSQMSPLHWLMLGIHFEMY